jgi:hypothetical protein
MRSRCTNVLGTRKKALLWPSLDLSSPARFPISPTILCALRVLSPRSLLFYSARPINYEEESQHDRNQEHSTCSSGADIQPRTNKGT